MSPTTPKMAYLTLRGLGVAPLLSALDGAHPVRIVEVHSGAAFGLGGAPLVAVMTYRSDPETRRQLLVWLAERGLVGLPSELAETDHLVAACGAAQAKWNWSRGRCSWLHPAEPSHHPYNFAC